MVDGGGLENHWTRKGLGGSNPSPSAKSCPVIVPMRHHPRRTSTRVVALLTLAIFVVFLLLRGRLW